MTRSLHVARLALVASLGLATSGCLFAEFFSRNMSALVSEPRSVPEQIEHPIRPEVRLSVLWVGHATTLVQIDDKVVLTDPVFTSSVGQISKRLVEPGLDVERVPAVDAVLVSHMHFDHLSLGSLELLEDRIRFLALPEQGLVYLTDFSFAAREVPTWTHVDRDGLRITAVPVGHTGFRYGLDAQWMRRSFTGWVVEYHGFTVYFPGDTSLAPEAFAATARRFPSIDVALLPIAPIHPRDFMGSKHMDPEEALDALELLGARHMVPIHFDTFENSLDAPGEAKRRLATAARRRRLDDRVTLLEVGEQRVFLARASR